MDAFHPNTPLSHTTRVLLRNTTVESVGRDIQRSTTTAIARPIAFDQRTRNSGTAEATLQRYQAQQREMDGGMADDDLRNRVDQATLAGIAQQVREGAPAPPPPAPVPGAYVPIPLDQIPIATPHVEETERLDKIRLNRQLAFLAAADTWKAPVEEVMADLQEKANAVKPSGSSQTRDTRARIFVDYEIYVECQDPTIPKDAYWHAHTLITHSTPFLDYLYRVTTSNPRYRSVKATTVHWWMRIHCHNILTLALDPRPDGRKNKCGVEVLVRHGLFAKMEAQVMTLIKRHGLSKQRNKKLYYDYPEVLVLIEHVLSQAKSTAHWRREVQHAQKTLLMFYFGLRPSTLGPVTQQHLEDNFSLRYEHIGVYKMDDMKFRLTFEFTAFKCYFSSFAIREQNLELWSVDRADYVLLDPTMWFLVDWFHLGAFGDQYGSTFIAFLMHPAARRLVLPEFLKRFLFPAMTSGGHDFDESRPMMARGFIDMFHQLAISAGLPPTGTYAFRRSAANWYSSICGHLFAALVLHHKPSGDGSVVREHYIRGTQGINFTDKRLMTSADMTPEDLKKHYDNLTLFSVAVNVLAERCRAAAGCTNASVTRAEARKAEKAKEKEEVHAVAAENAKVIATETARLALVDEYLACFSANSSDSTGILHLKSMFVEAEKVRDPVRDAALRKKKKKKGDIINRFIDDSDDTLERARQLLDQVCAANKTAKKTSNSVRREARRQKDKEAFKTAIADEFEGTVEERQAGAREVLAPSALLTELVMKEVARQDATLIPELSDEDEEMLLREVDGHPLMRMVARQARIVQGKEDGEQEAVVAETVEGASTDESVPEPEDDDPPPPPPVEGRTLAGLNRVEALTAFASVLAEPYVRQEQDKPIVEKAADGTVSFVCARCAAGLAKRKALRIPKENRDVPSYLGTYHSLHAFKTHILRTHNEWRDLFFLVRRTADDQLLCPAGDESFPSLRKLIDHIVDGECTKSDTYLPLYNAYKETSDRIRGRGKPSSHKGKEKAVADDDDDDDDDAEDAAFEAESPVAASPANAQGEVEYASIPDLQLFPHADALDPGSSMQAGPSLSPAGMVIVDPLLDAAELDFMFDVAPTAADDALLAGLLADISNDTTFAADLGEADPPLRQSSPSILSPPFPTPAPAPVRNARQVLEALRDWAQQIAISSPDAHDARTLGATLNELVPHAQPTASQFPAQTTQTSVDAPRRDVILDRGIARVRQLNEQGTLPPEVSQMMEETIASALEGPRILSDDDVVRVQYWMHRLFGN